MKAIKLVLKIGFAICSGVFAGIASILLLLLLMGEIKQNILIHAGILFILTSAVAWISAELAAEI